jgi:hypothetical protein
VAEEPEQVRNKVASEPDHSAVAVHARSSHTEKLAKLVSTFPRCRFGFGTQQQARRSE